MDGQGRQLDLSRRITRYYKIVEGDTIWATAKSRFTADEAARYTVEAVMGGDDQWQPQRIFQPDAQPRGYAVFRDGRLVAIVSRLKAKYARTPYQVRPVNAYGCLSDE